MTLKKSEMKPIETGNSVIIPIHKRGNPTNKEIVNFIQEQIQKWKDKNPHKQIMGTPETIFVPASGGRAGSISSVKFSWEPVMEGQMKSNSQSAKDTAFHQARRMFCIKEGKVVLAPPNDPRPHYQWFHDESWLTDNSDTFFKTTVRGFYDPSTNTIYAYTKAQFIFNHDTIEQIRTHLDELNFLFGLNESTKYCFGPKYRDIHGTIFSQCTFERLSDLLEF